MADIQVSKSVRRITAIDRTEGGPSSRRTVYKKRTKTPRVSRSLRASEEETRHIAEAYRTFAEDYLTRHARSNRQKRDGWLYDLQDNLFRAANKAQHQYYEEEEEYDDEDEDLDVRDEDEDED